MPVYHSLTATTPDDPRFEIRPQEHWNAAHALSLSGSEVIQAFSNAGNVSFAVETNGRITASANVTAAASPVNVTAGTTSGNLQTIAFSNSNGVSFGLNGSTITASHNGLTTAAQSNQVVNSLNGSTGQISLNVGSSLSSSTNGSSITFGLASNITTALQSAGAYLTTAAQSNQVVNSVNGSTGAISFATGSSLSSSQNGSTITWGLASNITTALQSAGAYLTTARASNDAIGTNTALTAGPLAWTANSAGLSLNAGSVAGTTSGFTGANISASITHNTAGLAMSMSVAAPGGGGNFSAGLSNVGNTAGDTGITGTRLVFAGGNNITLSQATDANGATVTVSGANAGGAQTGISGIIVSNTTYTSGTVSFSNANGISFGSSAGQAITASYTVPSTAGLISGVGVTGQNGNYTTTGLSFSNANGISFGTSAGSAITASHNGLTSQSNQALSAANGSFTFQTAQFSNANGVSFVTSAGSAIAASVETSYAASNHSHGNPTLALTNLSGTTASNSAGLTLSLSAAAPGGAASGTLFATGNTTVNSSGTFALSSMLMRGYGIVSLGTSNGSILVSSPDPTTLAPNWYAVGNTTGASSSTTFAADTISVQGTGGVSVGYSNGSLVISGNTGGGGGVTPVISAANGSYSFTTLSLSNANGFSFGTSAGSAITGSYTVPSVTQYFSNTATTFNGANISGSMTHNTNGLQLSLSVAAPGAAAENNAINLLGANTAGNTTATGSTIGWSGVNVTLSGTNASQVVISAPATSSLVGVSGVSVSTNGSTISVYDNVTLSGYLEGILDRELLAAQIGNAQLFVQPLRLRNHVQFAEICEMVNFSNASNSSNSATLSLLVGFYTRNNSSLSLVTSASSSYAITASGTVGSYSIYGGPREYPIGFTTTLTKGDYYIGFLSRTTTGGGAGMTWSNFVGSNINSAYSGRFSSANNATNQFVLGQGSYATTTTAIPGSIAFSQINGSAAANLRPVIYKLASGDLN